MNSFEQTVRISDFEISQSRLESQVARRIVSQLDSVAGSIGPDISERLRFARQLALQKAQLARVAEAAATVSNVNAGGTMTLSGGGRPSGTRWWLRFASIVPLLALVGGLVLIQRMHVSAQIKAAADIDAALLTDDLPPAAYADPVFAEYLRAPRD